MKQNDDNISGIDVDKAWNNLYAKLDKDGLMSDETEHSLSSRPKISLHLIAGAAVACATVIIFFFYFPRNKDNSLLVLHNTDNSGTLVTTLTDGTAVYLAADASISYPPAFADSHRKVKLNGNALFSVAKDEQRPFVIETNEGITIEVVGTFFAVQSSPGSPFELSVKQGKVNVRSGDNQTVVRVEAGETVQKSTNGLNKFKNTNSGIFNRFTDKMCFKDENLNNIVHAINAAYGSPTLIADQSLNNRTLTVTFEGDSVETMTQLICMALNLEQVNKQDTIFIRRSLK